MNYHIKTCMYCIRKYVALLASSDPIEALIKKTQTQLTDPFL